MIFFTRCNNLVGRRMHFFSIVFFLMLSLLGQSQPIWNTGPSNVVEASGTTTATTGTININIPKPANIVAGDLVIFILTQQNSNATANTSSMVPAGFTLIGAQNDNNASRTSMSAYYKIAGGAEPANYTVAVSIFGSVVSNWKAVVARVTGHNPTTPIAVNSGLSVNSNTIAIPAISTTTANSLLVYARSVRGLTTGNTFTGGGTTSTQRWLTNGTGTTDANTNAPSFQGVTESIAAVATTGTRTFSWTVSGDPTVRTAGIMFAINPAPIVPIVQPSSFTVGTLTPNKTNTNVPGYGGIYPTDRSYNTFFGRETTEASTGLNRVINTFTVNTGSSAGTYVRGSLGNVPFSKVVVKRETGGIVTGEKVTAFFESAAFPAEVSGAIPANTNVFLRPEYVGTLPELINSYIFNRGSDNVFANADATANNVGRIDLIFEGGITASSLAGALNKSGILLIERGANDDFKYAAITSLNAQQEVATLGPLGTALGTVANPIWGNTGVNIESMVFQRDANQTGNLRPSQHITSQPIAGTFITLASMGISAQQVFYGISIFPGDVTTAMNLLTLAGFPTSTPSAGASAGGLDWMAGGGFFTEAVSISGNVWNDVNGNAINSGENLITNGSVWANLVDPSTNDVIQSVVVSNLGSYFFPNITQNAVYKVILTTSNQTGNLNLVASTLPPGFVNTGVNLSSVPNIGNQTGVITVNPGETGLTNQNFGIQQPPTPGSGINSVLNPEGTLQVTVPQNTFTNTTNSTDVAPGNVVGIRITSFPTGASSIVIGANTYNSNVPAEVAALLLVIIPTDVNGNPNNPNFAISVDPSFGGAGSVTIPFVAIDNAGAPSLTTGTAVLTMNCAEYRTISNGLWSSFGLNGTWEKKVEPFSGDVWAIATNAPPSGALVRVKDTVVLDVDFTVFNCPLILELDNILTPLRSSNLTINPDITLNFSSSGFDGNAYFNSQPVIVKSTAAGTGAIGRMYETGPTLGQYSKTISPGDDNVTVERYIPDTKRRWNLLTFGVSSSTATILHGWGGIRPDGTPRKRVEMSSNRSRYAPPLPYGVPSPAELALSTPSVPLVNGSEKPFNFPVNAVGFAEHSDYVPGDGTVITGHSHTDAASANAGGYDWWPELNIPKDAFWWIRGGTAPNYTYRRVKAGQLVTTPSSIRPYIPAPNLPSDDFGAVRGTDWVSKEYINTGFGETSPGSGIVDPDITGSGLINVSLTNAYNTYKAFMLYTRGDRRVLENWYNATTLRPTGQIFKLNVMQPVITNTSLTQNLTVLANPYPAPIDFELLLAQGDNNTKIQPFFYMWDSRIDGASGNGGWRTVFKIGSDWRATITGSIPPADDPILTGKPQLISSSQGFMVQGTTTPGSITFTESIKAPITDVAVLPFEVDDPENKEGVLFTNFNTRSTTTGKLGSVDGVAIVLGKTLKTDLTDQTDIRKAFSFTGESSISLKRNGESLSVEGYPEPTSETIFPLEIKNLGLSNYTLTFTVENLFRNGREAFIRDKFLGTEQPIQLMTPSKYDFSGTAEAASTNSNRFEIVFKQSEILPVTFTSINAVEQQNDINVTWKVVTEEKMSHYEVEHSINGTEFGKATKVDAKNTSPASYDWLHISPGTGTHFYRVRAINKEGRNLTTRIVKVTLGNNTPGFKAFPTLVSENKQVTLQLISLEKGNYTLQVSDMAGRVISARTIEHKGGSASMIMQLPPVLPAGKYNVTLQGNSGSFIQSLMKD